MRQKTAENFSLIDQNGNEFNLYKNLDKKVLLIFYPKDDTPVCSTQLKNYSENISLFEESGIKLVAVNYEDENSHKQFSEKIGLAFPILSDKEKIVAKKFNALNLLGMTKRKAVLIDTNKKILYEKNMFSISYTKSDALIGELYRLKLI